MSIKLVCVNANAMLSWNSTCHSLSAELRIDLYHARRSLIVLASLVETRAYGWHWSNVGTISRSVDSPKRYKSRGYWLGSNPTATKSHLNASENQQVYEHTELFPEYVDDEKRG